jgi:hypothetical protein
MFLNALSHLANSLMVPACGWAYARVKSKQPFWHTDRPENHDPTDVGYLAAVACLNFQSYHEFVHLQYRSM